MAALGGGYSYMANMPDHYNLVVNSNHPLVGRLLTSEDEEQKEKLAKQLFDLALLMQNMLKGEGLTQFINRSISMIG